ncbi:hypothetical protein F5884DRAFT_103022 [Xylogone sp. PMI_703]|nr:hypothetical protein F5884DRAFT_103022 [Xylogone sp. PMI_703]
MTEYQTWTVTEPYLNIHCALGEGPVYEAATNTLRFVDIKEHRIHTVDLNVGPSSVKTYQLDTPVGVTIDIEGVDPAKKFLIGMKTGLAIFDRDTGKYELIKRYHESTENDVRLRSNDGAVDPQGRLWVGTMNDFNVGSFHPEGHLFRIDSDLSGHIKRENLRIPNGLGWSADQKTMFFTHSTERRVIAFDYDPETGNISNERTFYNHEGPGEPDGFAMDEEGNIWHAIYGESRVVKISPEGKAIGEIRYPTRAITCPVFIGTELWVTTAADSDKENGGAIFKVDVGAKGVDKFKFKLNSDVKGL